MIIVTSRTSSHRVERFRYKTHLRMGHTCTYMYMTAIAKHILRMEYLFNHSYVTSLPNSVTNPPWNFNSVSQKKLMERVHLYNNLFLTFYSYHKTVKELSNIVINIIKNSCKKRFFFYFFNVSLLNSNSELSVFLMTFILIFFKRKGGKRGAYYFCSICHFVILSRTLHTTCVILK